MNDRFGSSGLPYDGPFVVPPPPQDSRRFYERFVPARGQALPSTRLLMPPPPPPPPPPPQRPPPPPSPPPRWSGSAQSQNETTMPRRGVSFSIGENRTIPPSSSSRSPQKTVPTSAMTFRSSKHGRKRREERSITKHQLKRALKYGKRRQTGRQGVVIYEHAGITFVFDHRTNTEVTSYPTTTKPRHHPITNKMEQEYLSAKASIQQDAPAYCTSHSILLVDISGSMRNSDVHGARSRLAAVWLAIARDFVRQRMESGVAGVKDVVSVILMGDTAEILFDKEPTSWILFNKFVNIYLEGSIRPKGHGCYIPSLYKAKEMLAEFDSSPCPLMLGILSDGRPSDAYKMKLSWDHSTGKICEAVAEMARKLGRRLTVKTVGMGSANQFKSLKDLCETADDFGSSGQLELPSMTSSSLGNALSSLASSLTATQTEIGGVHRRVRQVTRESKRRIPMLTEEVDPTEFNIFMGDDVSRMVWNPVTQVFTKATLQHPEARGVAIRKEAMGEGTERFCYQFFEVGADGVSVVGEPLVAKESKFVKEEHLWEDMDKFAKSFCKIQNQAFKIAQAFNDRLDSIPSLDPNTARVTFLPCSVYYIKGGDEEEHAVVVEERLFGDFTKWNTNNGWKRTTTNTAVATLPPIAEERTWNPTARVGKATFINQEPTTIIKQEPDVCQSGGALPARFPVADKERREVICIDCEDDIFVAHDEVAQAFSHFSYLYCGRSRLVCDLQGVYHRPKSLLQLTDPVIHFYDAANDIERKYGRTDRGERGINDFLETHNCNALCNIICQGFFPIRHPNKAIK